jgi:hypothetical protein
MVAWTPGKHCYQMKLQVLALRESARVGESGLPEVRGRSLRSSIS